VLPVKVPPPLSLLLRFVNPVHVPVNVDPDSDIVA
jgi:hypothetical protein